MEKVKLRLMKRNETTVNLDTTYPFVLISNSGNPHIVFFEKIEDGSWDGESFNIMIARSKEDKMRDMMFIGGDFNENHGFTAWKRIA